MIVFNEVTCGNDALIAIVGAHGAVDIHLMHAVIMDACEELWSEAPGRPIVVIHAEDALGWLASQVVRMEDNGRLCSIGCDSADDVMEFVAALQSLGYEANTIAFGSQWHLRPAYRLAELHNLPMSHVDLEEYTDRDYLEDAPFRHAES